MKKHAMALDWLDKTLIGLLLVIFGGTVLHAPLTVGLGTLWPGIALGIKSWEEFLMGIALIPLLLVLYKRQQWGIYRNWLTYLLAAYAALHFVMIPVFYTGISATVAGLLIDLRYLLFFVLMYGALSLCPQTAGLFKKVFFAGIAVVIGFAVLQVTILPKDILSHIGYGDSTIAPYLTVDQNEDYVRINSTLRGPNPLGAYAVIALAALLAYFVAARQKLTKSRAWALGLLGVGSVVALLASYSRSALIAAVVAIGIVAVVVWGRRLSKWAWLALGFGGLLFIGGMYAFRDTTFVSQVILHEDPNEGNNTNSNDGHASSLIEGVQLMFVQPFGAGVGSTGSASLMTDEPRIIENQYLFIAHEVGWLGLVLFLAINCLVLEGLWRRRADWLALATFASGVGLAVIGLLLPVWVDDTVSIVWWGLAGLVLASKPRK